MAETSTQKDCYNNPIKTGVYETKDNGGLHVVTPTGSGGLIVHSSNEEEILAIHHYKTHNFQPINARVKIKELKANQDPRASWLEKKVDFFESKFLLPQETS